MQNLTKIKQALDEGKAFYDTIPILNPILLKDYQSIVISNKLFAKAWTKS